MEKLITVQAPHEIEELKQYLADKDVIAFDTEATGLGEEDDIIGFSICAEPDVAYYVILSYWSPTLKKLQDMEYKAEVVELIKILATKQLVMHNAIFDCNLVNRCYKVDLMPSVAVDTLILAHLLNENRSNALKALASDYFGADAKAEQIAMAESVIKNGGQAKINAKSANIEIYKADAKIIAEYGAKDALLTYKLMIILLEDLNKNPALWQFFFDDESMPLLKGPTYVMNTKGLKVDADKIKKLEADLKFELLRLHESILTAIDPYIKETYPGDKPKTTFNIGSNDQLSWLLFIRLGQEFKKLTEKGRIKAKELIGEIPYSGKKKREFIKACQDKGLKAEKFIMVDKTTLEIFKHKYSWVADLIEHKRLNKLLTTYVEGIIERMKYNIIRPSFLQHGTTSGRYSSSNPNFQNLPREDKRVKECIVPRPGKVFVGADYSQLEPRVFASFSQDFELLKCFERGEDFYSVIGMKVFNKEDCSGFKNDKNSFAKQHKGLRQISKTIALSVTYGTTAYKMVDAIKGEQDEKYSIEECQKVIDDYLKAFPGVKKFMHDSHQMAINTGESLSLFGRPRRMPEAKQLKNFGNFKHDRLPYHLRNPLNLATNHAVQSTSASIVNRSAIALHKALKDANIEADIVMQVHDSLIVECKEQDAEKVKELMQVCMETACKLPGVKLIAEPQIGKNLSEV